MDANQIYNKLAVDGSITLRCLPTQVQYLRNVLHKKQSLLNGLVGRSVTLRSKYDAEAGTIRFWYESARSVPEFEIIEDSNGTQVCPTLGESCQQRSGDSPVPRIGDTVDSEGNPEGGLATSPSKESNRLTLVWSNEGNEGEANGGPLAAQL